MSAVLQFPAKVQRQAKRRVNRAELDARHSWMMCNYQIWETTETDGADYDSSIQHQLKALMRKKWADRFPPLTMARMRRDIAEGRKLIEKRNLVKAWLQSLGADLGDITTPEQALFAAFDHMRNSQEMQS